MIMVIGAQEMKPPVVIVNPPRPYLIKGGLG